MTFAWVINIFVAEWIIRKVFKKVDNKLLNTVREGAAG
jgi:hypothetical protein